MHPQTLRKRVVAGDFTRLRRTPGRNAAIYLPREEVEVFKKGGFVAVQRLRNRKASKAPVCEGV